MHIVYAVNSCSDQVYTKLFSQVKEKPAFQSQKYHRLLIEGLAKNARVDVVSYPPVNRSVLDQAVVCLEDDTEGGARYHYAPAFRNPYRKILAMAWHSFWGTLKLARKNSAVVVDCLNRTTAFFALIASKIRRCRCVGIITDLPDMLGGGKLFQEMGNFIIRNCTDYVLLTEEMNAYIQNPGKPYVVLEGHADVTMGEKTPSQERKKQPRICFYAGGVSKQYGLGMLVEGFRKADLPNAQLHIFGPGDYVPELQEIAAHDDRIFYGGMLMNSAIVEKEMEATLLINPRPTHEEYVKYSFPSKNMEYMASGTPVLTTVLPGMPEEYHPYVYLLEEETAEGIAKKLRELMSLSDEALFEKGQKAREFILTTRNNVIQAEKILNMLKK